MEFPIIENNKMRGLVTVLPDTSAGAWCCGCWNAVTVFAYLRAIKIACRDAGGLSFSQFPMKKAAQNWFRLSILRPWD